MTEALVIGGGPAGLTAADALSQAGHRVLVAEAKPSLARKLLMAGKSGLNLTKDEPLLAFLAAYDAGTTPLAPMLREFGPEDVRKWANGLEQSLFTGSTGRVFPEAMKASPLLRAWLARLAGRGVDFRTRWRWEGWRDNHVFFDTPDGQIVLNPKVTVLACGGASWARLGSDGAWATHFPAGSTRQFEPANMGFIVSWSSHMAKHFGAPVKGIALHAGNARSRGEIVISQTGIEGGGIYAISRHLRGGAPLRLDLMPDASLTKIRNRLLRSRGKASLTNYLRKTLKLDPVKIALLMEFSHVLPGDLAPLIKGLPITHQGPVPMDQAISTAGGLRFDALNDDLMLLDRPGTFAAGEMLDWEAPTGGYLLTACLATGKWAGTAAAHYLDGIARRS